MKISLVDSRGVSGKKKEPKPKLFGPDIFGWGGGLIREGVGAKQFGMSSNRNLGKTNFLVGYPGGFVGISRGRPKTLMTK